MEELDCIDLFVVSVMWTAAVALPVFVLHGLFALGRRLVRWKGKG